MKIDIEKLQAILDNGVRSGEESGCQLVIYLEGKEVVNLCSGFADEEKKIPVTPETLFPVFSCGKGILSAGFHHLVEEGKIGYDDKVADYWPEYGCSGKENTLVWHFLTHRAGMRPMPPLDSYSDQGNWELMVKKLAAMKPNYEPGTIHEYHGMTFGWLVGELGGRAAGLPFKQYMNDKVLAPLGLEKEFYYGLPEDQEFRRAYITGGDGMDSRETLINDVACRRGFIPAANAHANARSMARVYSSLLCPTDGVKLLKDETVANAAIVRRAWNDPLKGEWDEFGLGWALAGTPQGTIFGHGGAVGSEGFADREHKLAVGFTKNRLNATHPIHPTRDQIAQALGLPIRHW